MSNIRRETFIFLLSLILLSVQMHASDNLLGSGKYQYPSQEKIDRQVDSVFRKLSTREKIAQIMVIDFTSRDSEEQFEIQKRLVKREKIGGLIPLGDVFVPAIKKMNELNKLAKIPMLITLDAEWGASMRWNEIPSFQRFIQLGALSSDSLVYEVGKAIAQECRALKIQVNYSPVADLNNNPQRHIVNTRCFNEEREKAAKFCVAMLKGMRDGGVAGSAKHFPGHGDTDVDSHLALPLLQFDAERIDSLELYPFKRLIEEGVDMVMVGHLSIPALDPSGTPSSISKPIVTELLREKLGYDGIICTDALNMYGVSKESGLEKKDIPLAAYKAGIDILLMPEDVESAIDVIENALKRGEITKESLDMRVKKMLALKARLGIFEKGYDPFLDISQLEQFTNQDEPDKIMKEKMNLIKKVSKETVTVLFNDNSAGLGLPVSFNDKKVAYVGFKNPQLGHEFGVLANRYGQVDTVILGNDASLEDIKAARNKLRNHDLIIFGFNGTDQSEYRRYGIVPEEIDFITGWAAEQPIIAVFLGSPYAVGLIPEHKNFVSYIVGYSDLQANNFAAAQVVFGGIPAKGVMPVSAASFKAGEAVVIPDRYREEYHHFVGSVEDSLMQVKFDMGNASAILSVLPQVGELVASGKIRESDISGENPLAVSDTYVLDMFRKLGMNNTAFNGKQISVAGYTINDIVTTRVDLAKFFFAAQNGGVYAGERIFSPYTAELILKVKDTYMKD